MLIRCKDFIPKALDHAVFSTGFETFSEAIDRANAWIRDSGVAVLNVETVVLPNLPEVKDTSQVINTRYQLGTYLFQVVRVWYDGETLKTP